MDRYNLGHDAEESDLSHERGLATHVGPSQNDDFRRIAGTHRCVVWNEIVAYYAWMLAFDDFRLDLRHKNLMRFCYFEQSDLLNNFCF